jgi:methyl-accepting chemotaxis protein
MRLSSITIGKRLAMAFGAMGVLTGFIAGVGVVLLASIQGNFETIEQVDNRKIVLSAQLREHAGALLNNARLRTLTAGVQGLPTEADQRPVLEPAYAQAWQAIQAMPPEDPSEAQDRAAIEQDHARFGQLLGRAEALLAGGGVEQARDVVAREVRPAHAALDAKIKAFAARHAQDKEDELGEAQAAYWVAVASLIGLASLCVVLAMLAGWVITRSIVRPIHYVRDCALRMASGDLSVPVERRQSFAGRDETSQMIAAMQTMHNSLCSMVSAVSSNASTVACAAEQISKGNNDLSQRTEEQALSLQMAASTMQGLTSTVLHHADGTVQAAELASGARGVAGQGGVLMQQVVHTMDGIDGSSKKIADIIGVIDSIAFQTNILALNAAVEAARAGAQGRGFAVVAAEVRALAQRSAAAAREIKALITSSVEQVGAGAELVRQAGVTMGDIVAAIDRVSAITQDMSANTREQRDSIALVGSTVGELDQNTQHNAALVEQSAAAASQLSQEAQTLLAQVSRFRLPA